MPHIEGGINRTRKANAPQLKTAIDESGPIRPAEGRNFVAKLFADTAERVGIVVSQDAEYAPTVRVLLAQTSRSTRNSNQRGRQDQEEEDHQQVMLQEDEVFLEEV